MYAPTSLIAFQQSNAIQKRKGWNRSDIHWRNAAPYCIEWSIYHYFPNQQQVKHQNELWINITHLLSMYGLQLCLQNTMKLLLKLHMITYDARKILIDVISGILVQFKRWIPSIVTKGRDGTFAFCDHLDVWNGVLCLCIAQNEIPQ